MSNVDDKETWKNAGAGEIWIKVLDPITQRMQHTPVRSGAKVAISTRDRQFNQDLAASPDKDFFSNGTLTPVRLVDTAEDYQEISSNPNLLSEDDMVEILKIRAIGKFRERIADITNLIALNRMIEMAESEEVNVTMAHSKALNARLQDLRGDVPEVVEVTQSVAPSGPSAPAKMNIDF